MTTLTNHVARYAAKLRSPRNTGIAIAVAVLGMTYAWVVTADAAATNAGDAQIVNPADDTALNSGGTDTDFTVKLPDGAACSGDTATDGYKVNSYVVKTSTDPTTITWDGNGPTSSGTGDNFRQPLWKATKQRFVNAATNAGDGVIINMPAFDFSVFNTTTRPSPGAYLFGIACTVGDAGPNQLDKYWDVQVDVVADAGDPRGVKWQVSSSTATTTTTTIPGATTTTTTTIPGATTTTTTTIPGATTTTTTTIPPTTTTTTTIPPTTTTTPPANSTTTSTTTSTTVATTSTTTPATTTTTAAPGATTTTTAASGMNLSSPSGSPGGGVIVTAGGFAPGTQAQIYFLSTPVLLASVPANSGGVVSASVTIPSNATTGTHSIEVRGTGANGAARTVSTSFTVTNGLPRTGGLSLMLTLLATLLVMVGGWFLFIGRPPFRHSLRR